jgi:hypothetical protein
VNKEQFIAVRKLIRNDQRLGWKSSDGKVYDITGFSSERFTFAGFASIHYREMWVRDFRVFLGGGIEATLSLK